MPQLDDFKSLVREIMAIGSTLDGVLDSFVKDALREFEGAIELPYQKRRVTKTITQADRTLTVAEEIKKISWARRVVAEGDTTSYFHIPIVQDWQAEQTGPGTPLYVWRLSENVFEFDLSGPESHVVEMQFYVRSSWPLAEDSPLWTRYARELRYRTIVELATVARKPDLLAAYERLYVDAMMKLQVEADALQYDYAELYMGGSK